MSEIVIPETTDVDFEARRAMQALRNYEVRSPPEMTRREFIFDGTKAAAGVLVAASALSKLADKAEAQWFGSGLWWPDTSFLYFASGRRSLFWFNFHWWQPYHIFRPYTYGYPYGYPAGQIISVDDPRYVQPRQKKIKVLDEKKGENIIGNVLDYGGLKPKKLKDDKPIAVGGTNVQPDYTTITKDGKPIGRDDFEEKKEGILAIWNFGRRYEIERTKQDIENALNRYPHLRGRFEYHLYAMEDFTSTEDFKSLVAYDALHLRRPWVSLS